MSNNGDSGDNRLAGVAAPIIIIIIVMVTMNTTLDYSGSLANTSSSATTSSSIQVSSSALTPLAIDGQSESIPGYCKPSLTTTKSNDVLILFIGGEGSGPMVSVVDNASLTWHHRASAPYNFTSTFETIEEWYAISPSPLSNDNITVKSTTPGLFHCFVLGVSGANLASPFDLSTGCASNNAVPQIAASSNPTSSGTVTVCTSGRNDLLLSALFAVGNGAISSMPAGFSFLAGGGINSFSEAYELVSTTQTNLGVTWTFAGNDSWGVIGDAIASNGS
ncbi:MAG: hypothetical protein OK457_03905 [Thaumarchaeota archaeon]|nr:hypothetical protein [Nitrososphaerota archaeon]